MILLNKHALKFVFHKKDIADKSFYIAMAFLNLKITDDRYDLMKLLYDIVVLACHNWHVKAGATVKDIHSIHPNIAFMITKQGHGRIKIHSFEASHYIQTWFDIAPSISHGSVTVNGSEDMQSCTYMEQDLQVLTWYLIDSDKSGFTCKRYINEI